MKPQPIEHIFGKPKPKPISFGIYKSTMPTYYGKVDRGVFNNKIIDIYTAYFPDGSLKHKLYYLTDTAGKWIKSKLKFFKNNKCYYIARSKKNVKLDGTTNS